MGKWVTAGIIVFWLVMTGLLVHREVMPAIELARTQAERTGTYEELLRAAAQRRNIAMGIYHGAERIGETSTLVQPLKSGNWVIRTSTHFQARALGAIMPLLGKLAAMIPGELEVTTEADVGSEYKLTAFCATVRSSQMAQPWAVLQTVVINNTISGTLKDFSGQVRPIRFQLDPRTNLAAEFTAPLAPRDLSVGRRWRIEMFNPVTGAIESATAEVIGQEPMTVNGLEQNLFVVRMNWRDLKLKSWVTSEGEVAKQEAPFGLTLIREEGRTAPPQ